MLTRRNKEPFGRTAIRADWVIWPKHKQHRENKKSKWDKFNNKVTKYNQEKQTKYTCYSITELQPVVIYRITQCGSDAQFDQPETIFKVQFINLTGHFVLEQKVCCFSDIHNKNVPLVYCPVNWERWTYTEINPRQGVGNSTVEPPGHSSSDMKGRFLMSLLSKSVLCLGVPLSVKSQNKQAVSLVEIKNSYHSSPSSNSFWHHLCLGKLPFILVPHASSSHASLQTFIFHVLFSVLAVRLLGYKWWNFFYTCQIKYHFVSSQQNNKSYRLN